MVERTITMNRQLTERTEELQTGVHDDQGTTPRQLRTSKGNDKIKETKLNQGLKVSGN